MDNDYLVDEWAYASILEALLAGYAVVYDVYQGKDIIAIESDIWAEGQMATDIKERLVDGFTGRGHLLEAIVGDQGLILFKLNGGK